MKIKFLTGVLTLSLLSQVYSADFVKSGEDFYIHTTNHVNNVNRMTDEVFAVIKKDPAKWGPVFGIPKGVPIDNKLKDLLKQYMRLHDKAKLNTNPDFLEQHNLKKPVIAELYEEFGGLAKKEKVDLVNRVDGNVGQKFFADNKIPAHDWRRTFFAEFEHFTDGIERGENPVTPQEMGRAAYKESGRPLFKIENNRLPRGVKLSETYKAMKEAGVVGTTPQSVLNDLPGSPVPGNKLPASEIKILERKAELALMFEKRYPQIAVHYNTVKAEYNKLFAALEKAGIHKNYFQSNGLISELDDFARFELIKEYEKTFGKIQDLDDPTLSDKFKKFFFEDINGKRVLTARSPGSPSFLPKGQVTAQKVNFNLPKKTVNSECGSLFELIPSH